MVGDQLRDEGKSPNPVVIDAIAPAQIARRVESASVAKAHLSRVHALDRTTPGGASIAFGGMPDTVGVTGSEPVFGPTRLLAGIAFSLGPMPIVVGGAELFTGNNLIAVA